MSNVIECVVMEEYKHNPMVKEELELINHFNVKFNARIQRDRKNKLLKYLTLTDEELIDLGETELAEILYNYIYSVEEVVEIRQALFATFHEIELKKHVCSHDPYKCEIKHPTCDFCSWEEGLSMGSYDNSEEEIKYLKNSKHSEWIGILIERVNKALESF
jgi:hypothetical protein